MKVLGAGLSKTGTLSLARALSMLGLRTIHYDERRLNDIVAGLAPRPDFRRYDDVDAVVDLPAAWFFEELLDAYPTAKCILTIRDEDKWWDSIRAHAGQIFPVTSRQQDPLRWDIRNLAYGSASPHEFAYRKRFREHNARVRSSVPAHRLLVIDITAGDGWAPLCDFLGVPVPNEDFPHGNVRERLARAVAGLNAAPMPLSTDSTS